MSVPVPLQPQRLQRLLRPQPPQARGAFWDGGWRALATLVAQLVLLVGLAAGGALAAAGTNSPTTVLPTSALPSTAPTAGFVADCQPPMDVRGPGVPDETLKAFAAAAAEMLPGVRARLGDTSCEPITITLVGSMADAPRLDPPWHLPSWAAGAAQPEARRIVVGIASNRVVQDRITTLKHELAHVTARSASGGKPLPRWLDEGIARVVAGEHGIGDLSALAHARLGDRFLPLEALADGFPSRSQQANLAYAQAGRAVSLLEARGPETIPNLLHRVAAGDDVDDALRAVSGRATWQLDVDVQRSLSAWAAIAIVGIETDFAMAGCGVMVAVVGVRARRRQRRRLEEMDDDDPPSRAPPLDVVAARWTVRGQA